MKTIKNRLYELEKQYADINITNFYNYYATEYVSDTIEAEAHERVPIYYGDMLKWIEEEKFSSKYMQDAFEERLIDVENYSFPKHIQIAIHLRYTDEIYSHIDDIKEYIYLNYINDLTALNIPLQYAMNYIDYDVDEIKALEDAACDCLLDYIYQLF
jgi:hypothetical protein